MPMKIFKINFLAYWFLAIGISWCSAYYYKDDFSLPFSAKPEWQTNFAYGRNGAIVASPQTSRSESSNWEPGLLTLRGFTHEDSGLNGYWACRNLLLTNLYSISAERPFGFEVIRTHARLEFSSTFTPDENSHVYTGLAMYADPDARVTEIFDNNTANQWNNGAGYLDFVDFEGAYGTSATIYQNIQSYYAGDDFAYSNQCRVAVRPDGSTTNITNLVLRRYRTNAINPINNETFASATPPGYNWDGSSVDFSTISNISGSAFCVHCRTNTGGWLILPVMSNVVALRFSTRISNNNSANLGAARFVVEFSTNSTNANAFWMPFQSSWPILSTNVNGFNTGGVASTYQAMSWDGPSLNSNIYIRIRAISNTVDFVLDAITAYVHNFANNNPLGFRIQHNGSTATFLINPNPYNSGAIPYPSEWLEIDKRSVFFTTAVQAMVTHAQRRQKTGLNNIFAWANYDDFLIRSATDGSSWLRQATTEDGLAIVISNQISSESAGLNLIALQGFELKSALAFPSLKVGQQPISIKPYVSGSYPKDNEAYLLQKGEELLLFLGKQISAKDVDKTVTLSGFKKIALASTVQVKADMLASMPSEKRGQYSTCGWEKSKELFPPQGPSELLTRR